MKTRLTVLFSFTIFVHLCLLVFTRDAPIITIPDQGQISGFFIKMYRTQTIVGYLGIPYATKPIEDRRFMPPGPFESWDGIRDGSIAQKSCWSVFRTPMKFHDEVFYKMLGIDPKPANNSQFSEDCLYLNIYVPDGNYFSFFHIFNFIYVTKIVYYVLMGLQRYISWVFTRNQSIVE